MPSRGMFRVFLTLPILLAACLKDESVSGYADPTATYVLQELNDAPFPAKASLRFPAEGEVHGTGPCNSFRAKQSVPYPWIEITALAATKRACPDLAAETAYFTALQQMTLVEALGDVLILSNDAGAEMVFRAQD